MKRGLPERGFTIIEVMVAMMILAVSVVSIFGAQFTAVATTEYSKHITQAMALAECRMSEISLKVLTEDGFQLGSVEESGDCCEAMEDEEIGDYTCSWEIKPVELPDLESMLTEGDADGGLGLLGDLGLGEAAEDQGDDLDIFGALSSFMPLLSDMLSEGIRRVTVTVEWKQGTRTPKFVLSQHIVHPTEGSLGLMNQALLSSEDEAAAAEDAEAARFESEPSASGGKGEK